MLNKKKLLCFLLPSVFFCTNALANSFEKYLDNAKEAYAQKDYELAKMELNDALKVLSDQSADILDDAFPPAPAGWEVSKLSKETLPVVGTFVKKTYSKDDSVIEASISYDNPVTGLYSPLMMGSSVLGVEKVRIGREYAFLKMEEDDPHAGSMNLLVSDKYLIIIDAKNIEGKDFLIDFLKSWDIKKMKNQE